MAKVYVGKLSTLLAELNLEDEIDHALAVKHFFSGAALYVNNMMVASWSPGGLAFKLADEDVNSLIFKGKAKPLKYFPNGHIKQGYALFENPGEYAPLHWKPYFLRAAQQV